MHKCPKCSRAFVRQHDLRRHASEQHGDGKKPCMRCRKVIRPGAPHQCLANANSPGGETTPSRSHSSFDEHTRDDFALEYIDQSIGSVDEYVCSCCAKPFEDLKGSVLPQHFKRHLSEMIAEWECSHCQLFFQHPYDLWLHDRWVEQHGQCGFDFEHQIRCTGHHPQTAINDESSGRRIQDRQAFCARLRSWEYEQFRFYRSKVTALAIQQIQDHSVASSKRTDRGEQDYEPTANAGTVRPGNTCMQGEASPRLQEYPAKLSLLNGLTHPLAWDGVKHVFDFNADHLYSPDWNSSDKHLCKQFLLLIRNLVRLKVNEEEILSVLQAVALDSGKLRRLFEWQQITVPSKTDGARIAVDEFALVLLEHLCRDLGCE